jgi:acyl carrier protein
MNDIRADVRRYVEENFIMGAATTLIADSDSFIEHHVLDSTGFLELITHLEEVYGITVEDEEMIPENLDSVNAVCAFVTRKQG